MTGEQITRTLRNLEKLTDGSTTKLQAFLDRAEKEKVDLIPYDLRVDALCKKHNVMRRWYVVINKNNATFYSLASGWTTLDNASRFSLTQIIKYRGDMDSFKHIMFRNKNESMEFVADIPRTKNHYHQENKLVDETILVPKLSEEVNDS